MDGTLPVYRSLVVRATKIIILSDAMLTCRCEDSLMTLTCAQDYFELKAGGGDEQDLITRDCKLIDC